MRISRALCKSGVVGVLLASAAGMAGAADTVSNGPSYISFLPGYSLPSKAYGTTGKGFTVSAIYGSQFAPHLAYEVNLQSSTFETGSGNGTDYYQHGATLDLVYLARDRHNGGVTPFALAGVGAAYDDFYPNNRDGAAFIANVGLGLVSGPLFSNGIRLRFEARFVYDGKEGGHGEGRALAGIDIPLGRVEHHIEYLPGKVETREIIKEIVRPWVDSDNDGVDDEHDRCPDTPRGMKVDAQGCVIDKQTISLQGVTFDFNKARLTLNAQAVLDIVSKAFTGQPSLHVEIAGHTDSIGSESHNLLLSQKRAESVRSYLILHGARPDQLTAHGYGKSQLLISPETGDADREHNRRVELRVITP